MRGPRPEKPDLAGLLGPEGPLAAESFYEHRPGQVALAEAVWEALRNESFLVAEAGTGTGKSLAYLLPALFLDRRVVIATRTKALQEQLVRKDLPLCEKILGRSVRAVAVKGRANYLCLHYWSAFLKEPLLPTRQDARHFKRLQAWAEETETGDKAEWEGIPEDLLFWRDVNARGERCLGSSCPLYADCYVVKLRREAEAAEVVVTNHHLLFADLALKNRWDAAALPDYAHLVLDEAHEAEEAATSFFGLSASRRMLQEWLHDAAKAFAPRAHHPVHAALASGAAAAEAFFGVFARRTESREVLSGPGLGEEGGALFGRLAAALDAAALAAEGGPSPPPETQGLVDRLDAWREAMDFAAFGEDDAYVRWVEAGPRNVTFGASPIDVGPILKENLYSALKAAVLTSATLTVGGTFGYFLGRMGLGTSATCLRLESPFRHEEQGLLYVPSRFPQPQSEDFLPEAVAAVRRLLSASGGRAFVLCTSFRNMRAVAEALEDLPWPLLVQGQEPKGLLLERFREAGDAVLVATSSFWQGVDVQGEALSLVVLDKLPFAVPTDPLTRARIERIRREGGEPFSEYQLPSAAILLQQGVGRLIRSTRDRGVVACLDVRLRQKGYGKVILASLPAFPLTDRMEDVEAFFGH